MKVYKLNYQHHKDIVDNNVLTMFVTADNQDEVEAFAKKLHYKIEHLSPLTKRNLKKRKRKIHTIDLNTWITI